MSDEQAAIIIQKNVKGYVARKKYGPLINVSTGNLDEETVMFIRKYFNRWKAKSLFQVLILFRAAKYQEFIYFCQQVHLYNQNVVGNLQTIQKEKVQIDNIDTNVEQQMFIGEETPTVWKIPFNIKDFPYCESSHLRDTVAVPVGNDEDLPWDDPFKTLDKGCQTNFTTKEETFNNLKKKNERFTNFITTPYSRDPKTAEKNYKEQTYKYIEDTYEDEQFDKHFVEDTTEIETAFKSVIPEETKSTSTPSTPENKYSSPVEEEKKLVKTAHINIDNKEFKSDLQPTSSEKHNSPYREKLMKRNQSKVNPIAELELKGKRIPRNDTENEDEPPFNFQAMLRKTNYNRCSLKRESPPTYYLKTSNMVSSTEQTRETSPSTKPPMSPTFRNSNNNYPSKEIINSPKISHAYNKSPTSQNNILDKTEATSEVMNGVKQFSTDLRNNNELNKNVDTADNVPSRTNSTKKKKAFLRHDSLDSITLLIGVAKDFEKEALNASAITDNGMILEENDNLIKTEILPGLVIVGGPATDL